VQVVAPTLELDALVRRSEEALGEGDGAREVEPLRGDGQAALGLPSGTTDAPVPDRAGSTEHRVQRLEERPVGGDQRELEDEADSSAAVSKALPSLGGPEAPLAGDETTEKVARRLQNRW
jgi:hypothetical protein